MSEAPGREGDGWGRRAGSDVARNNDSARDAMVVRRGGGGNGLEFERPKETETGGARGGEGQHRAARGHKRVHDM